jgi:hypothetical protein
MSSSAFEAPDLKRAVGLDVYPGAVDMSIWGNFGYHDGKERFQICGGWRFGGVSCLGRDLCFVFDKDLG